MTRGDVEHLDVAADAVGSGRGRDAVLWAALAAALSPSLADLAAHWAEQPWALVSALFAPLWVVCAVRDRSPRRPHADGYLLLALGLAIALAGVGGGIPRLGRPGIPLAVVGLARALGRPALPRALLAVWLVPVPDTLVNALAPGLETAVPALSAGAAHALGIEVDWTRGSEFYSAGGRLLVPGGALLFGPADGGLPLAFVLAGLGWYRAAARGGSLTACIVGALRAAPWAIAIQALGLVAASALAIAGAPSAAQLILHYGVWMTAVAVFLLRERAARPRPP